MDTTSTDARSTRTATTGTTDKRTRNAGKTDAKAASPKPPKGVTVFDPARADQGAQRHRLDLEQRSGLAISPGEVGYYLDNMQARLIQKLRSPGISFERSEDAITVRIAGINTFDTNSYRLKPEMKSALNPLLEVLVEYNRTRIQIAGHTDDSGPAGYNQKLSQQRAFALARILIEAGVDARRIAAIGFGESQPLQPNTSAAARSGNRRLELRIEPIIATTT